MRFLLVSALFLCGCQATTQTPSPTPEPWTNTESVVVASVHDVIALIRQWVDGDGLSPETKTRIDSILTVADDALSAAATILSVFAQPSSFPSHCRLHANLAAATGGLMQVDGVLADVGVPTPPALAAALGALATITDGVAPNCDPSPSSGGSFVRAALAPRAAQDSARTR